MQIRNEGLKYAKSQFFLAKKPDPRGGRSMSDFGKTRIHGHVFFENETCFGSIIKTSHLSGLDLGSYQLLRSLIVNDMPSECYCEVINYASPKIGYLVDIWHKARETDGIYPKLAEMRADYVKSGSWKNILGERGDFVFRDYELYFAISIND